MVLSKQEKETIIRFNEEEDKATVLTPNKALIRKLDGLCSQSPMFVVKRQDDYGKEYQVPKDCISIRKPSKISDETRVKMASRAKRLSPPKKPKRK